MNQCIHDDITFYPVMMQVSDMMSEFRFAKIFSSTTGIEMTQTKKHRVCTASNRCW
jgi:hypothetical protein